MPNGISDLDQRFSTAGPWNERCRMYSKDKHISSNSEVRKLFSSGAAFDIWVNSRDTNWDTKPKSNAVIFIIW